MKGMYQMKTASMFSVKKYYLMKRAIAFIANPATFLLFAAWMVLSLPALSVAQEVTVLFLPLKVNSAVDASGLAGQADSSLDAVLASRSAARQILRLMPRQEALSSFDYSGVWPPSPEQVSAVISGSAALAEVDFVVAGNLTRIGESFSVDLKMYEMVAAGLPAYYFREVPSIDSLDKVLDSLVGEIAAYTGRDFLISNVVLRGNDRIDSGAIMRHVGSRAGDFFDAGLLRRDLKNIFKMGYFDDVQVEMTETDKGKEVIFVLKEKPVIASVSIEGEKELKEDAIQERVSVVANTIINPKKVAEAVANIRSLYKEKGFYNTHVEAKLSYPEADKVDVRFVIEEGAKVFVKKIRFAGNNSFKDKKLAKVIETSEKGLFSWLTDSGLLKRDILEQDAARLASFYHHHGYIEAKIGEPVVEQEGKWLYVTFNISEGDRYRVGDVSLTGDLIEDQEKLLARLNILDEEFLSRQTLREDILHLNDYYAENGYAFAEASPRISKKRDEKRVDIVINIQKGALVHLNRIIIKGNTRTRDKVIRRDLAIKEKGVFNSKALRVSNQRLQRLGYFEDVSITPEPALEENMMDVIIEVKEKPTGAFSLGAGYSSVDNLMVMGEISQNNFLGKGQRLALQANLSGSATRYNLSFTEPRFNDTRMLLGIDLYNWERELDDYTKDSYGGALRLGFPLWERWQMGFTYGWDHTDVKDIQEGAPDEVLESLDLKVTSFVRVGFSRDTVDKPFDPSKGSVYSLNIKYAGGPLGGDSAFTKVEGSSQWYFPSFLGTTFHIRGAAGQVFENETDRLPVYEKFYLGGLTTIRGFKSGEISHVDENGEEVGGDRMWYANLEWIFPLVTEAGLKGVAFFDMGNVYEGGWEFDNFKKTVGFGFRWLSPMGPLRLEWGYNIDPEPDEDQSNWDFSIGGAF
jgi:outer membrane protein insertion porin family